MGASKLSSQIRRIEGPALLGPLQLWVRSLLPKKGPDFFFGVANTNDRPHRGELLRVLGIQKRNAVASGSLGDYVMRIDLAGRIGPFRLAFRARAHVFLPLFPTSKTAALRLVTWLIASTSERTSR